MSRQDKSVISLPKDAARVASLRAKLEEYRSRLGAYKAPEQESGIAFKIEVLERVLQDGELRVDQLRLELMKKYGEEFKRQIWEFNNACSVIYDYCETGGLNTCGGTGFGGARR